MEDTCAAQIILDKSVLNLFYTSKVNVYNLVRLDISGQL